MGSGISGRRKSSLYRTDDSEETSLTQTIPDVQDGCSPKQTASGEAKTEAKMKKLQAEMAALRAQLESRDQEILELRAASATVTDGAQVVDDGAYVKALEEIGGESAILKFCKTSQALLMTLRERTISCSSQDVAFKCLSFDDLYHDAETKLGAFKEALSSACTEMLDSGCVGAVEFHMGPIKRKERAGVKVKIKYGGDVSRLTDLLRATLVFDTLQDLYSGLEYLIKSPRFSQASTYVCRFEDRFQKPLAGGYRDVQLMVVVDGHLGELQANVRSFYSSKTGGGGHTQYRRAREMNEHILLAAIEKQSALCEALLEHHGDPNVVRDLSGLSALHYAALHGQETLTRTLLKHNAKVFKTDKLGRSPLQLSMLQYHFEVSRMLLSEMRAQCAEDVVWLSIEAVQKLLLTWQWLQDKSKLKSADPPPPPSPPPRAAPCRAQSTFVVQMPSETQLLEFSADLLWCLQRVRCPSLWRSSSDHQKHGLDALAVAVVADEKHGVASAAALLEAGLPVSGPAAYALSSESDSSIRARLDKLFLDHIHDVESPQHLLDIALATGKMIDNDTAWEWRCRLLTQLFNERFLDKVDFSVYSEREDDKHYGVIKTSIAAAELFAEKALGNSGEKAAAKWFQSPQLNPCKESLLMRLARLGQPRLVRRFFEVEQDSTVYDDLSTYETSALDIYWQERLVGGRFDAALPDSKISVSSVSKRRFWSEMWRTRLDNEHGQCWAPIDSDTSPFLGYDFGRNVRVTHVIIKGRSPLEGSMGQIDKTLTESVAQMPCVTSFLLEYIPTWGQVDDWTYYGGSTNPTIGEVALEKEKTFEMEPSQSNGPKALICNFNNSSGLSVVTLQPPLVCKALRVRPETWKVSIELRCDMLGYDVQLPEWLRSDGPDLTPDALHGAFHALQRASLLGWETEHVRARVVKLLTELGQESLSIRSEGGVGLFGDRLLHAAIRLQDKDLVEHILDLGADWREQNDECQTSLDLVAPLDDRKSALPASGPRRLVGFRQNPVVDDNTPPGGGVTDQHISASSQDDPDNPLELPDHQMWRARLDTIGKCWKARDDNLRQWLQFQFQEPVRVMAIQMLGRSDCDERVMSFRIQYRDGDDGDWNWYLDADGEALRGNVQSWLLTEHRLRPIPRCTRLRLCPEGWEGHIAMRADVIGLPTAEFEAMTGEQARALLIEHCSSRKHCNSS